VNNAAIDMGAQIPLFNLTSSPSGIFLGLELLDYISVLFLVF
jgi:hypothetical protein